MDISFCNITMIMVNPLFHIMAKGICVGDRPESGEYDDPDADSGSGS